MLKQSFLLPRTLRIFFLKNYLFFKGPKGQVALRKPDNIRIEKKMLLLTFFFNKSIDRTWIQLVKNILKGLTIGFRKRLLLKGIGYRAIANMANKIELKLGYSHPVYFINNKAITLSIFKSSIIELQSPFADLLGNTSATIKSLRYPDSYKAKGIMEKGETIKTKPGKKT